MNSKFYYGGSTNTTKKEELAGYIEQITNSLNDINDIDISGEWKCSEASNFNSKFTDMKSKINSIITCLNSYESFLSLADKTYSNISDDVRDALSSFKKGD